MNIEKFIHKKPFVIAGPCSAESEDQLLEIAKEIRDKVDVFRAGIWKPRTSPKSFELHAEVVTKGPKAILILFWNHLIEFDVFG